MPIFVNNKPLDVFQFSGGECHVKINTSDIGDKITITAYLNSSDDIMRLLLVVDAVRRVNPSSAIYLTIPYFPYARQDRVCNPGESLSVKVMADLINNLHCASVTIYDPHSDVTPALLTNCRIVSLAEIVSGNLSQLVTDKKLALVSPDAGAEKKTRIAAKSLSTTGHPIEVICSSKTRDTFTGNITATEVHGNVQGKNLLIVDDICDGGRTFVELAKALKDSGANDIYLYVTHGIFSKGLSELAGYFKQVYCFHTMLDQKAIDEKFLVVLGNMQ